MQPGRAPLHPITFSLSCNRQAPPHTNHDGTVAPPASSPQTHIIRLSHHTPRSTLHRVQRVESGYLFYLDVPHSVLGRTPRLIPESTSHFCATHHDMDDTPTVSARSMLSVQKEDSVGNEVLDGFSIPASRGCSVSEWEGSAQATTARSQSCANMASDVSCSAEHAKVFRVGR